MRTAIRKHLGDFLAIIALFVIALGAAAYILANQRLRFPLVQKPVHRLKVELPNAQAVTPGQGQTVRVAGVEVGQIGKVELEDGVAVVELAIEPKYKTLIRKDATVLLRAKTGVKDMFVEVDPGDGPPMRENERIQVSNTLEDVDPDEFFAALDADTRDYLRLLISGAGKGLEGRGSDLQEVFARLGPLHRDLERVSSAIARRRANLRRLIHNYGMLVSEIGRNDRDVVRLVQASEDVFSAFAAQDANITEAVRRLPGALSTTATTLGKVDRLADTMGPAFESLRPAFRQLDDANEETIPLLREGTPILRDEIRPFARAARPFTRDFGRGARGLNAGAPALIRTFRGLNRLFNIGAYNSGGAEGLTGDLARDRARDEGYLYWLAWLGQNTVSMFSTSDANGPFRRFSIVGVSCSVFRGIAEGATGQLPEELQGQLEQIAGVLPPDLLPVANPVTEPGAFLEQLLAEAKLCNAPGGP
ncbi:MAG TPA: MlaD family protein [Thermoleophilaceae bacterium]|nr:MlaD family protein [Thermoleophilaceae bacterium]